MVRRLMQLIAVIGCVAAGSPLFAQAAPAAAANPGDWARPLAAMLGLGLAAGLCGLGQGRAAAAAAEGAARNPGAWNAIRFALILGLVFMESLTLYVFAVVFIRT